MSNFTTKEKQRARLLVKLAVKSGELTKPETCEKCNKTNSRIAGHHPDYSKPLDVRWLCISCHSKLHGSDNANIRWVDRNMIVDKLKEIAGNLFIGKDKINLRAWNTAKLAMLLKAYTGTNIYNDIINQAVQDTNKN